MDQLQLSWRSSNGTGGTSSPTAAAVQQATAAEPTSSSSSSSSAAAVLLDPHKRLLLDPCQKYPKKNMRMKALVLDDLISRFKAAKRTNKLDDDCEGSIKDRFHFVRKPESKPLVKKNLQTAVTMLKKDNEKKISDLITIITSSKFKIAADAKTDFSITRGISTMSCFEKIPREPVVDVADGNSCDSRPDVTEKLENISIDCDLYDVNNTSANHAPPCMDLIKQTVSLDICTNLQNKRTSSPLPIVESTLINFTGRFRE